MKTDQNFFVKVFEVVRKIPPGRVSTYGAIAKAIGAPGASRMVGWAMNNSHSYSEHVPAQRVVNRNGVLTGKHHFRYPELMQELLESEGVEVENDKVVKFKELFWDPFSELV